MFVVLRLPAPSATVWWVWNTNLLLSFRGKWIYLWTHSLYSCLPEVLKKVIGIDDKTKIYSDL